MKLTVGLSVQERFIPILSRRLDYEDKKEQSFLFIANHFPTL